MNSSSATIQPRYLWAPGVHAPRANGKTPEQLLLAQIGASSEHAAKLVQGGLTTAEKVARASEAALTGCGLHIVYAKTLQKAAHRWLSTQRAAQMKRNAHVI